MSILHKLALGAVSPSSAQLPFRCRLRAWIGADSFIAKRGRPPRSYSESELAVAHSGGGLGAVVVGVGTELMLTSRLSMRFGSARSGRQKGDVLLVFYSTDASTMCARTYAPRRPLSSTALTQYPTNICLFFFLCKTKKNPYSLHRTTFLVSHPGHPMLCIRVRCRGNISS